MAILNRRAEYMSLRSTRAEGGLKQAVIGTFCSFWGTNEGMRVGQSRCSIISLPFQPGHRAPSD